MSGGSESFYIIVLLALLGLAGLIDFIHSVAFVNSSNLFKTLCIIKEQTTSFYPYVSFNRSLSPSSMPRLDNYLVNSQIFSLGSSTNGDRAQV